MIARTAVRVCPVWVWAMAVWLKMALPQAWASRWSRWQGRIVPASFIRPGGRAVFIVAVQPRKASDATEMARSDFFMGSLSGAVRWLEAPGGDSAEHRLPPEWFGPS